MAMAGDWVEGIFSKLVLVYGSRFQQQWAQLPAAMVKADWAHELDGITSVQLNHALHNLPADFPPNVLQFKALCREHRPEPMRASIPMDRRAPMQPRVKEKLAALLASIKSRSDDPLAGARSLRAKEQNGILLTRVQREFWRQALKQELMREQYEREEQER